MKTLKEFKDLIQIKDVEGNRTYLSAEVEGVKYGQSFPNTVYTRDGMINEFCVFYYQLYQSDHIDRKEAEGLPY